MAYFVIHPNGEESLGTFLSPDPSHLGGVPIHGYNTSGVKKSSQTEKYFLSYASRQTQMHYPRTPLQKRGNYQNVFCCVQCVFFHYWLTTLYNIQCGINMLVIQLSFK